MMTYTEARDFNRRMDEDARTLTRTRKGELQATYRDVLKADGVIWESGYPSTKDGLIAEILSRRYPLAQANEATHVLYHAPSSRWPACDHCQARPATETVNTPQLRPGDVVQAHGFRVRVDEVREYVPPGTSGLAWSCPGTVLNAAEVLEAGTVPASFLQTYRYDENMPGFIVDREDAWTLHGTVHTPWIVELPRPRK